jgi:hypothetical protein
MSEFRFTTPKSKNVYTNETLPIKMNSSTFNQEFQYVKNPSVLEYILIVWIFSFILEEFRQVFNLIFNLAIL